MTNIIISFYFIDILDLMAFERNLVRDILKKNVEAAAGLM